MSDHEVTWIEAAAGACTDPPAESCSDAGCPVHGDEVETPAWDRFAATVAAVRPAAAAMTSATTLTAPAAAAARTWITSNAAASTTAARSHSPSTTPRRSDEAADVNEDERGITPADVTSMTVEPLEGKNWRVIIEQGNGDVIKVFDLTEMERVQLGLMLDSDPGKPPLIDSISFLDPFRRTADCRKR